MITLTRTACLKEEIEFKKQYLENDLYSNGKLRYFLAAEDRGCIVGTIEYGPASDLICTCTNGEYENLYELGTVFVRPDYQGQGIGNLLLNSMTQVLRDKGINQFCLDSGYSNAQKIWRKKFGFSNIPMVNKIIGLFPDQLLQISEVLGYFSLYDIFGKVGGSVPVLLVMYAIFSIVIQLVIYGIHKKK